MKVISAISLLSLAILFLPASYARLQLFRMQGMHDLSAMTPTTSAMERAMHNEEKKAAFRELFGYGHQSVEGGFSMVMSMEYTEAPNSEPFPEESSFKGRVATSVPETVPPPPQGPDQVEEEIKSSDTADLSASSDGDEATDSGGKTFEESSKDDNKDEPVIGSSNKDKNASGGTTSSTSSSAATAPGVTAVIVAVVLGAAAAAIAAGMLTYRRIHGARSTGGSISSSNLESDTNSLENNMDSDASFEGHAGNPDNMTNVV